MEIRNPDRALSPALAVRVSGTFELPGEITGGLWLRASLYGRPGPDHKSSPLPLTARRTYSGLVSAATTVSLAPEFARAPDIDGVLERMDALDSELDHEDGVGYFNRMYREVTRLVRDAVAAQQFEAATFLERLDVNFANLFFGACADEAADRPMSPAWAPLLGARTRPDTHPIQFALAGMNAHICHELAFAVVDTCRELGSEPLEDCVEHLDFTRTNEVLASTSPAQPPGGPAGALGSQ